MRPAGAFHIRAQLPAHRFVDCLRLVGGGVMIGVGLFKAGGGLFEHVFHAGAGPGPKPKKSRIHIPQRIQSPHGRIDPAIHGNIGRAENGRVAYPGGNRGIFRSVGRSCRRGGDLRRKKSEASREQDGQYGNTHKDCVSLRPIVQIHKPHFSVSAQNCFLRAAGNSPAEIPTKTLVTGERPRVERFCRGA